MKKNKKLKIWNVINTHVLNNKKEYILISILFIVGVFFGVMFINNIQETQKNEITTYLNRFIEKFKDLESVDNVQMLKMTVKENFVLALALWFFGTTVIGIPIVFGIILYRGFCLGYTIASVITIMGLGKGILFILTALLLQNIIFIPAILAIGVSRI